MLEGKEKLVDMVGKDLAEKWISMVKADMKKESAPINPQVKTV